MNKRSILAVTVLALLLSLVLIVPAGAVDDGYGFDVDCTGAHGWGTVPLHGGTVHWVVFFVNTDTGEQAGWEGYVEEGMPFDVDIAWPDSPCRLYYEVYLPIGIMGGHLECECPPPPPPPPPPPCGMGCTPGYWKQPQHLDSWAATGYSPDDDFDTTFGVDYFDPDITLLDALKLNGGGVNALARHAVAGLLDASHPDVDYPLSVAEVIALAQTGTEEAKDTLDMYNNLGCPLD